MNDTTHSILHSARRFFTGTMLSRISGFLRDICMAAAFGTQESVAAFLVAYRLALLLRRLFGEGALQSAFIPHFEGLRQDDPNRAAQFFRDLNGTLALGIGGFIVVSMTLLGSVYQWLPLSQGNQEIVWLTILLMPSLLFICLFGLNASLLQCNKSYLVPSIAPVACNVIWIAGVLCLWSFPAAKAMPWLAGFLILACFTQWLVTVPATLRVLRHSNKHKPNVLSADIKRLGKALFLGIIGVAATQINNALDPLFARYADPEGPAFLWYAVRIQQLPLALIGIAISGALLPPLSRALKTNDRERYKRFLSFSLKLTVGILLPITVGLLVLATPIISLLYGRGDFGMGSTVGTSNCLWGYTLGLLPMGLVLILAPAFYAQGDYRIPTQASVASVACNIGLNSLFVLALGWGTSSVALATSISAYVNMAWLAIALSKRLNFFSSLQKSLRLR